MSDTEDQKTLDVYSRQYVPSHQKLSTLVALKVHFGIVTCDAIRLMKSASIHCRHLKVFEMYTWKTKFAGHSVMSLGCLYFQKLRMEKLSLCYANTEKDQFFAFKLLEKMKVQDFQFVLLISMVTRKVIFSTIALALKNTNITKFRTSHNYGGTKERATSEEKSYLEFVIDMYSISGF